MADPADQALDLARRLARQAGCRSPLALTALDGGRNNRVYRVDLDSGRPLLLKSYFRDARDTRDRRRAEWDFLNYAWGRGIRSVPDPIVTDADAGVSLLGFVEGRKVGAGLLAESHIDAAAGFAIALNVQPRELSKLVAASEACFSMAEHIDTVERRVRRLSGLDETAPHVDEAREFVGSRLIPQWNRIRSRIESSISVAQLSERLAPEDECASPSDFGFHNALVAADGTLTFLDFEYAGRDDPAKLVCDFFCQPEIPVGIAHFSGFVAALRDALNFGSAFACRCDLLLDAYRIKWVCIMLNDFLPLGDARRAFALDTQRAARCRAQLDKAAAALSAVTSD